jgi:hypothetical protein
VPRPRTPFVLSPSAKSEPGWRYYQLDASHSPNVTAPEALMALRQKIISERA